VDIHKPKAAHNWREFAVEIATIICGIVIALGLEQLVEAVHRGQEVTEAKQRLSVELGTLLGQAEFRARASACVERRLDELAAVVGTAAKSGRLPPLGEPGFPSVFVWGSGAWQSAASGQTIAHLSPDEVIGYSSAYKFIGLVDDANNRAEGTVWTTLYGLAGPGRPFDAADAARYRQAISEARYLDSIIGGMGVRAHQALDAYHIPFNRDRYNKVLSRSVESTSICQPIATTPPSDYGTAPARDFIASARAHPLRPQGIDR
jgi:hypothetical protein